MAYTAAFWGTHYMLDTDIIEESSQAMTLIQELEQMQMDMETDLKAKYKPKSKSKGKKKKSSSVFAEFFAGIIMISFALPMIWMNERKQVKMDKINGLGRAEARTIYIDEPSEEND